MDMGEQINVGDRVRIGVWVCGEWKPMSLGVVTAISNDSTLASVDVMSLHGGRPWVRTEQIGHLRKEEPIRRTDEIH